MVFSRVHESGALNTALLSSPNTAHTTAQVLLPRVPQGNPAPSPRGKVIALTDTEIQKGRGPNNDKDSGKSTESKSLSISEKMVL